MYAATGLMYPYLQSFTQDLQLEEFCCSQKPIAPSGVAENGLWGGDAFLASELVIEEPVMGIDPMAATISMISCGEDVISPNSLDSIENRQLLSDVFYECRNDLLAKEGKAESGQLLNDVFYEYRNDLLAKEGNPAMPRSEVLGPTIAEDPFQNDKNPGCLNTTEAMHEAPLKPGFLDFPVMDFSAVYGMRRAFSEGDIETLGNSNLQSQIELPPKITGSCFGSEDRREKLSRYRSKKSRRNFDRKIKYACRKALADSQPRIRGRFAKTEETESCKKQ